jgi:ribosome modulation factor
MNISYVHRQEEMTMKNEISQAYRIGYEAYDDGKSIASNPYHPKNEEKKWTEWRQGWRYARSVGDIK